jgi:hypothetical protein
MNRSIGCRVVTLLCLLALTTACTTAFHSTTTSVTPVMAITATSGTPQSHAINAAFGVAMVATVTTNGAPTSGVSVTFTAPSSGPSGTFSVTTSTTANAITGANGQATSPTFVANNLSGNYTVTASVVGATAAASFSLTNTNGAPAALLPTSGTPQSAPINATFTTALAATVVDSGQNPLSGVTVTFTAPATGASGTFADSGSNVTTAVSNASGVATAAAFTANGTSGADTVTATAPGVTTPANFILTNSAGAPASITATGGTPQTAQTSSPFSQPLSATVLDSSSNPISGVAVTFTAPATGASGTFANGTATETDTTNASGVAISTTFVANATTGSYAVTASTSGVSTPASFSLTNRIVANTYVFFLSGQEPVGPFYYALAGSVEINPTTGAVIAGEQDYNDGIGFTSPAGGDQITGGSLIVNATTGQGTLTLITNNTSLPGGGTEVLGVQFANTNHAMVIQFDGSATSSGSMDLQTSGTPSGGYAFTLSGVDNFYGPAGFGGVFSISSTTVQGGSYDTNDNGNIILTNPMSGTLTSADSYGRGTISSTLNYGGSPISLAYYVVGPEVLRIIDTDTTDSGVGSAFGQGVNATNSTNASLGTSLFGIQGTPYFITYATVGMFTTSSSSGSFSGVADDNELVYALQLPATPISGTYAIASNGYGNLTITLGDLGDVSALGLYMTDPNLNLIDPNNTASGLGGGLIVDLDPALPGGTGLAVPQTDTSATSFTGNYAFGAQDFYNFSGEFDFVAQGAVTGGVLSGTGMLSDPGLTLGASTTNLNVTFSATPQADSSNPGRYTMFSTNATPNPFQISIGGTPTDLDLAMYQASGGLLFWMDESTTSSSVGFGMLEQQGSLTGLPLAVKGPAKSKSQK